MKTMTKISVLSILSIILTFSACKKGETGPAGANGTNGTNGVALPSDGFIQGTLTGNRQDNTPFNESFNWKYYFGNPGDLDSVGVNYYIFSMMRLPDILGTSSAGLKIETFSKTATTGTITLEGFDYEKTIAPNKKFLFNLFSNPTGTLSGFNYNPSTGVASGNYTFVINAFSNSSTNTATITGSFQSTMVQTYQKKHLTNSISNL